MSIYFRRGLLAGLIAGVLAGIFHLLASESFVEQALRFEVAPPGKEVVEVFSREAQRVGLMFATALYGTALGGVFGFTSAFLAKRPGTRSAWERSLRAALVGFVTFWLVPFLKYPANPPAVGNPETIGYRTAAYLGMVTVSIAASVLVFMFGRRLSAVEPHVRHLAVGGVYVLVIALTYSVLPRNPDPVGIPAQLLWSFRVMSAAGQALLWASMGAGFGLLTVRAERKREVLEAVLVADGSR